jgi:hypothetical protein
MCFMLYAGTDHQIPRREFDQSAPNISVQDLNACEEPIRAHFRKPEVQNIGSTSSCGCDFPKALLMSGIWPDRGDADGDEEYLSNCRANCRKLFDLLKTIDDETVELYGIWAGDETEEPMIRESISLGQILDPDF